MCIVLTVQWIFHCFLLILKLLFPTQLSHWRFWSPEYEYSEPAFLGVAGYVQEPWALEGSCGKKGKEQDISGWGDQLAKNVEMHMVDSLRKCFCTWLNWESLKMPSWWWHIPSLEELEIFSQLPYLSSHKLHNLGRKNLNQLKITGVEIKAKKNHTRIEVTQLGKLGLKEGLGLFK